MTIHWSDEVTELTQNSTRSVRYVPPHLRNVENGVKPFENPNSFTSESTQYSRRFDLPSRGRGRGRARSRRGKGVSDDLSRMFENLDVSEVRGGNGGDAINFDSYEDIPVDVSGSDVPPRASSFEAMGLGERLSENVRRCRYAKPTPVQCYAIPIAMAGRDLMACAQTGSGKTAAFCFPIISGILKNRYSMTQSLNRYGQRQSECCFPSALVLSPTRELANQIHDEANKFAFQTGVKIVAAYGGASISGQFRALERGVDILVATPGRLSDMVERGRVSLRSIKYLVLDEADRMLDMGFEPQIRMIVQNMDMPLPGARQTMLFSATFPSVIQRMASDFLSNYVFLAVGRVGSSTDLIEQRVEYVQEMDKRDLLLHILYAQQPNGANGKYALTLIFVETKKGADALEHWLSMQGLPAIAIHGNKVQMERERALRSFKSGVTPILVATDVAARGLDIPHVAHVINFDLPRDINDYVHRIGRTGRAGKSGCATAFFSDKNMPIAKSLAELMQESKQEVPHWLLEYAVDTSYTHGRGPTYRSPSFGGHDYRSAPIARETCYYPSYGGTIPTFNHKSTHAYNDLPCGPSAGEYQLSANAEPYIAGQYVCEENYGGVVPSGWD